MPNVENMIGRFQSHLARVSGKALEKEYKRIDGLLSARKVSYQTAQFMRQSAPVRLAWLAQ